MPMTRGARMPAPAEAALMLDMDGTLLDIAPTPDAVRAPPGLIEALIALREALGGALAIVTGRPVAQVDALLPGAPHAVAGEHGGAVRRMPGGALERAALADLPGAWADEAEEVVRRYKGALLERKERGLVLHYRGAPTAGPALREAASRMIAPEGERFTLMAAHMAWEVKPRGADKGTAVNALARAAPFVGRKPVFIGDDVTDEDGMAACRALGGEGFRVDECFGSAEGVRAWLKASARALRAGEGWPGFPAGGG